MQQNANEQKIPEETALLSADPRWLLARRIVRSSVLGRSTQLNRLLLYVCHMALAGRADEISEQRVGIDVFRRSPNYDPGVDGIVRSHATRLRQRLEEYFRTEGIHEPLILQIPRGGYAPIFLPRETDTEEVQPEQPLSIPATPNAATLPRNETDETTTLVRDESRFRRRSFLLPMLAGFALALLLVLVTVGAGLLQFPRHAAELNQQSRIERRFWSTVFPENAKTYIVPGDSGLVLYETALRHQITLSDYIAGEYRNLKNMPEVRADASKEYISGLASRRYTSIVDLRLAVQLAQLPEWNAERNSIIFARDLTPAEAQNNNLILIGSLEANPWVALLEPEMNFVLVPDGKGGFYFRNRNPRPKEMPFYIPAPANSSQGSKTVYGDIAYMPNPSGQGKILLLSGLWMAGTQASGHFVLNSDLFSSWLASIAHADGSIPSFELLVMTSSIQGSATKVSILASRVEGR
jgi:hypothetical protein